jgi:hypothetical protein
VTYAVGTSVPVDRSKAEIERLLIRYGADHFASGWRGNAGGKAPRLLLAAGSEP